MNEARRRALLEEYGALTAELRAAAQQGEVAEVARLLAARQRLIDEARTLDAEGVPLTQRERRMLEAARADELAAHDALGRRRGEILGALRKLADTRRAHGGYASHASSSGGSIARRA